MRSFFILSATLIVFSLFNWGHFLIRNITECFLRGPISCTPHMDENCHMNLNIDAFSSPLYESVSVVDSAYEVFHKHAYNGTVAILQLNTGYIPFGLNVLESLYIASNGTSLLTQRIVVWAMTQHTAQSLQHALARYQFGIYLDTHNNFSDSYEPGGTDAYYLMMRTRVQLFLNILAEQHLGLFFMDADIVFLRDPWPYIVANNGRDITYSETSIDPFRFIEPDLVYSTDAVGWYYNLYFPFEDFSAVVPRVCGGLFFARPTINTVRIYTDLYTRMLIDKSANDQWTMDQLLNDGREVILVGPLDKGMCRRMPPCRIAQDTLKIRMLQQFLFPNGRLVNSKDFVQSSSVSVHMNMWNINKTQWFVDHGLWFRI